jgi:pimeloyl-ACP methyl ester carboxylesterase
MPLLFQPMRRSVRTSDGTYLAVVEFGGEGAPILLLHGLMGRASTWWAVARRLTAHGRVIGLDARGHGRSQAAGPWTADRMAADAAELLEPLGPALVIGHSMGGLQALVLAATRPELVRGIVVEDMGVDLTGLDGTAMAWFDAVPQPFPSLAAVREGMGEYMTECVEERADGYHLLTRIRDAHEIAAEWLRTDRWDLLERITCPALLLEAEQSVVPRGQMAEMARRMPDARHRVVQGANHLVHADPAVLTDAVIKGVAGRSMID